VVNIISTSGVFAPLLDAVNTVKAGTDNVLVIKYSYDEASLSSPASRLLLSEHFKIDIENTLFQWEDFISNLYSNKVHFKGNLTVQFKHTALGDEDLLFRLSHIDSNVQITQKGITFNNSAEWGTTIITNKLEIMSYAIYAVGSFLGLGDTTTNSPMNRFRLAQGFKSSVGVSSDENGVITTSALARYKSLAAHFKRVFGGINNTVAKVYGCTDSSASNFNSSANTEDGSCVETQEEVTTHPASRMYIPNRDYAGGVSSHKVIWLGGPGTTLHYLGDNGIEELDNYYAAPTPYSEELAGSVSGVLSLDGGALINILNYQEPANCRTEIWNRNGGILKAAGTAYTSYVDTTDFTILSKVEGVLALTCWHAINKLYKYYIGLESTADDFSGFDCVNPDFPFGEDLGGAQGVNVHSALDIIATTGNDQSPTRAHINQFFNFDSPTLASDAEPINHSWALTSEEGLVNGTFRTTRRAAIVSSAPFSPTIDTAQFDFFTRFYAEVKTISISPLQDSYQVIREGGQGFATSSNTLLINDAPGYEEVGFEDISRSRAAFAYNTNSTEDGWRYAIQPMVGYSFVGDNPTKSMGLLQLSSKQWSKASGRFAGTDYFSETNRIIFQNEEYITEDASAPIDTSGGSPLFDMRILSSENAVHTFSPRLGSMGAAPITNALDFVISKRLRELTGQDYELAGVQYITSLEFLSFTASNSSNPGVGKKLAVIGTMYGMLLTFIDNITGKMLSPAFTGGLELQIPAGDDSLLGYSSSEFTEGGFRMKTFVISPMDNFIYAIAEDPDTGDSHIIVYDITSLSYAYILDNARSTPNPFDGELTSVVVGVDGCVYFYSVGSSDYIKVNNPDSQESVDILLAFPSSLIQEVGVTIHHTPKIEVIDLLKNSPSLDKYLVGLDRFNLGDAMEETPFEAGEWNDPNIYRQLNVLPAVDKGAGATFQTGDYERIIATRLVGDGVDPIALRIDINNLNSSGSTPNWEALEGISTEGSTRMLSLGNSLLGAVTDGGGRITVLDRTGNTLGVIQDATSETNELIGVESYVGADGFGFRALIETDTQIASTTIYFVHDENQTAIKPLGLSLGFVANGSVGAFNVAANEVIMDTCIVNTGLSNTASMYIAVSTGETIDINKVIFDGNTTTQVGAVASYVLPVPSTVFSTDVQRNFEDCILKYSADSEGEYFHITYYNITPKATGDDLNPLYNEGEVIVKIFVPTGEAESTSSTYAIEDLELGIDHGAPIKVISMETPVAGKAIVLVKGGPARDVKGLFAWNSLGFLPIEIMSTFVAFPSDFDSTEDVPLYDGSLDYLNIVSMLRVPDGSIYLGTSMPDNSLSRIINPASDSPRYAIRMSVNTDVPEGYGPIKFPHRGEFGGAISGPTGPEDPVIPMSPGCTTAGACNYNPNATWDDGSCAFPDPDLTASCGNGGCSGEDPYVFQNNCGDCFSNFASEDTGCYVCPEGVDLGGGVMSKGCIGSETPDWCYEDPSACTIYGCIDTYVPEFSQALLCNGVLSNPSEYPPLGTTYFPGNHDGSLCNYSTNACECDGMNSLTPIIAVAPFINCTDCVESPTVPNTLDGTYCSCEQWAREGTIQQTQQDINSLYAQGVCNCEGTILPEAGCNCSGGVLDNINYCDCGIPTDTYGIYCDCEGKTILGDGYECLDPDGTVLCDEYPTLHFLDADGDGYYDANTQSYKCSTYNVGAGVTPSDGPVATGVAGADLWIESTDALALGPDDCDGFSNDCNYCIPYTDPANGDFSLVSAPYELDDCGVCFDPTGAPPVYACDCAEIPEGYCDCDVADLGCLCDNGVANIPYELSGGEGGVCHLCDSSADGSPQLWDYCMDCDGTSSLNSVTGFIESGVAGSDLRCVCGEDTVDGTVCCPGYKYDSCAYGGVGGCVLNALDLTATGCDGGCNTAIVPDVCGECNGSLEEIPQCGCGTTNTFIVGTTTFGEVCDCNGNTVDQCGVCNGAGIECVGCMDEEAYNFNPLSLVGCDECCEYYGLTNPDDFPVVDFEGFPVDPANMEGVLTADSNSTISTSLPFVAGQTATPDLVFNSFTLNDGNVIHIPTDNAMYTSKCQVITVGNHELRLDNPQANAEVTHYYTTVVNNMSDGVTGDANITNEALEDVAVYNLAGKVINFYFRIEGAINPEYSNIAERFSPYLNSHIFSIATGDGGNSTTLESDLVDDTPITATLTGPVGQSISEDHPNYHVYQVTMAMTDYSINEIEAGINLAILFSNTTEGTNNTDIYVAHTCPTDDGIDYINSSSATWDVYLTAEQFVGVAAGVDLVVVIEEATPTSPLVTVTYKLNETASCTDACLDGGNDYAIMCSDPEAENYVEVLGVCQEYQAFSGGHPCTYPEVFNYYCSNPLYVEFEEVDSNIPGTWVPDTSLCINPTTSVETEVETIEGTYLIEIEHIGDVPPVVEYDIYTKTGRILQDETGDIEVRRSKTGNVTKTVRTIKSVDPCAGFTPIAFRTNDEWLRARFTIMKDSVAIWGLDFGGLNQEHSLTYGASSTVDGSAILKLGASTDCIAGCGDTTVSVVGCTRSVQKDVKEFTDFTVEIMTEISPAVAYEETTFIIYDITTGERLVDLVEGVASGETVVKKFKLSETTALAVKVISKNMLIYRIIDEQGNILKHKSIYDSSYFEPFTFQLEEYGCTDKDSPNYNANAVVDDGSCISKGVYACVKEALFSIDSLQCDSSESNKALQVYAVYQSYKEALKGKNKVKIEMYGDKLSDLCNCKTC